MKRHCLTRTAMGLSIIEGVQQLSPFDMSRQHLVGATLPVGGRLYGCAHMPKELLHSFSVGGTQA
jgi:hypothetical protein